MPVGKHDVASSESEAADLAKHVADLCRMTGHRVAVAESLTAGHLLATLGAAPEASTWLRGGVVAYAPEVKFEVLGVTPGPVNTAACARELALGVRALMDAELAVATTGVGGPGPDEGVPAGTVFVAVASGPDAVEVSELHLPGRPEEVLAATVTAALRHLAHALDTTALEAG